MQLWRATLPQACSFFIQIVTGKVSERGNKKESTGKKGNRGGRRSECGRDDEYPICSLDHRWWKWSGGSYVERRSYVGWSWLLCGLSHSSPVVFNHCPGCRVLPLSCQLEISQFGCIKWIGSDCWLFLWLQFYPTAYDSIHIWDTLEQISLV